MLQLEDAQNFKDNNGNVIEIETKVADVEKAFGLKDVVIKLREKTTVYKEGIHYEIFSDTKKKILLFDDGKKDNAIYFGD